MFPKALQLCKYHSPRWKLTEDQEADWDGGKDGEGEEGRQAWEQKEG